VGLIEPGDMIEAEPLPGWKGRFFHSENMTFAHYEVDADAVPIHEHHHEQEEVWNVVQGTVALVIDGTEHTLHAGSAAVIPPNVPHRARVIADAKVVVADHPVRHQIPGSAHPPAPAIDQL